MLRDRGWRAFHLQMETPSAASTEWMTLAQRAMAAQVGFRLAQLFDLTWFGSALAGLIVACDSRYHPSMRLLPDYLSYYQINLAIASEERHGWESLPSEPLTLFPYWRPLSDAQHGNIYSRGATPGRSQLAAPPLTCCRAGLRIPTVHLLDRDQGAPPQVSPDYLPGQGSSSRHLYVRLLVCAHIRLPSPPPSFLELPTNAPPSRSRYDR